MTNKSWVLRPSISRFTSYPIENQQNRHFGFGMKGRMSRAKIRADCAQFSCQRSSLSKKRVAFISYATQSLSDSLSASVLSLSLYFLLLFFPHVCDGVAICVRAASHPTGITPYRPSQNEKSKGKESYDCERARLKRLSTGFVNFVPAAAYYFWTALLCSLFSPYSLHLSTI